MKARFFHGLIIIILVFSASSLVMSGQTISTAPAVKNLALIASPSGSSRNSAAIIALNDGLLPNNTGGMRSGANRPPQRPAPQWLQYEWIQPVRTGEISVFWWNYENTVKLPNSYRIKYWDGNDFVPVKNVKGLGLLNNQFNITLFDEVQTTRLRLEVDSADRFPASILEWIVVQAASSPDLPPVVNAGIDRSVILGGKTYLAGKVKSVTPVNKITWTKLSGPGNVSFADANSITYDCHLLINWRLRSFYDCRGA